MCEDTRVSGVPNVTKAPKEQRLVQAAIGTVLFGVPIAVFMLFLAMAILSGMTGGG